MSIGPQLRSTILPAWLAMTGMAVALLCLPAAALAQDPAVLTEAPAAAEPAAAIPDPADLEPGWWQSLRPGSDDLAARIDSLLTQTAERVAELPEERQENLRPTLDRLEASLRGYLRLSRRAAEEPPPAGTLRDSYTIDELLATDQALRRAAALLESDRAELESRREAVAALSRETDSRYAAYLNTAPRSAERLAAGVRVMALRAGLLLEEQQLRLLSAQVEARRSRVTELEEELRTARERLALDDSARNSLQERMREAARAVTVERRRQREAEAALIDRVAASAPDSPEVALARQEMRLQSVREAVAEVDRMSLEARLDLLALDGDPGEEAVAALGERRSERRQALERIRSRLQGWRESAESGLSETASQYAGESDREALEARANVAAAMVSELQRLRRSVGDLALLQDLVSTRMVQQQGRILAFFGSVAEQLAGSWDTLRRIAMASIVAIGDTPITLAGLFRVLVVLTIAFWVSRILRAALNRMGASRRTSMSASSLYSLGRLLHYVIIIAGIVIGLSSIGLDFTNLALVASALGVGIGFGLQSVVSNFVSGLILLFERSLNVGDFVELDSGVTGMIKEINVRSTLLNTNDNVDILVPNSEFVNGRLINWTLREAVKRVHVSFGVAYGTDKDLTRKAALEAAERVPLTLTGPGREPQVWLVNFGDSSLDYELVVWLRPDAVRRPAAVQAAYLWEIETALGEHGIEIPFPQRDLHFKSGMEAFGKSESKTENS